MKKYKSIIYHYEDCFKKHGDSNLGVDWPNKIDADTRYKIMLEVITCSSLTVSLLDFGCGLSHLYEFILKNRLDYIIGYLRRWNDFS